MSKALTKPRWESWEHTCIRKAFEQKIPLKIIAVALGRTVTSINKKIKGLGLRELNSVPGPIKRQRDYRKGLDKISADISSMQEIVTNYAPLRYSEKCHGVFKNAYWTFSSSLKERNLRKDKCIGTLFQENSTFSFSLPLSYIITRDHHPQKVKKEKVFGDPYYVPLIYVEKWASSEGFQQIKEDLRMQGLSYWKDGKYFSKAQLLIYVNRMRHERKLQPLAIWEEEG